MIIVTHKPCTLECIHYMLITLMSKFANDNYAVWLVCKHVGGVPRSPPPHYPDLSPSFNGSRIERQDVVGSILVDMALQHDNIVA